MNLAIDIGNTRTKWALFDGGQRVDCGIGLPTAKADRVLLCATGGQRQVEETLRRYPQCALLAPAHTPLPIALDYATPDTLGPDRVAAACGAYGRYGGQHCLVVDAGTCITIDYLDAAGTYRGGAILPGVEMKLHALHTFTEKLPLIELSEGKSDAGEEEEELVAGRTTRESILAGVLKATRFEVEGFVRHYRRLYPGLRVLMTGGDAGRVESGEWGVETYPYLVLEGLNEIMRYGEVATS